ncbi:MAG: cupin domain-containing protein [Alphaproteobacteria bacterium]|nr:cupin domain-containing protein [Alphaproteobacteria bacterium]
MTIHHHPDEEILVRYAAGELAEALSLLVATHIAMCPACRSKVRAAEAIGGALVQDASPVAMSADALDSVLARVEVSAEPEPVKAPLPSGARPILPEPLRSYAGSDLDGLDWRRLGRGAYHIPLVADRGAPTARLLRIPAGRPVPEHGHNGLELTMVLQGSFVDGGERFAAGDVETADADLEHQPVAEPGQDCICLAVTDAPLRFRGPIARLAQPFIGI